MLKLGLRVGTIATSIALAVTFIFSYQLYGAHPADIVKYLAAEMGSAAGTEIRVPENPYNTVAQQLAEKEKELEEREEALGVLLEEQERESESMLNLVLGLMTVLFLLIASNFYLDFKERKS